MTTAGRSRARGACLRMGVLALLLWVGPGACQTEPPRTGTRSRLALAGCWSLELQEDELERDSLREWLPRGTLPGVLELDTAEAGRSGGEERFAAYSWFDGRRETDPFSAWTRISGDSIRVQKPGALSGLMLRLTGTGDTLTGSVVRFTDVRRLDEPGRRRARVRARSVECPARRDRPVSGTAPSPLRRPVRAVRTGTPAEGGSRLRGATPPEPPSPRPRR